MNLKFKFLADIDPNAMRVAVYFLLSLTFFEAYIFDVGYLNQFAGLLASQSAALILVTFLYIAAAFYCFFYFLVVAFSSEWKYKIVYFLLFTFAVFYEYGYQKALGRFSDLIDIEIAIATTPEQKLSSIFLYLNLKALIPCCIFLYFLYKLKPRNKARRHKGLIFILLLFGFFFIHLSFVAKIFPERKFPTVSPNAFARTSADYIVWNFVWNKNKIPREKLTAPELGEDFRPANNIIFVLDESVRGDHLSLNGYERKTTPFLEDLQTKGILHNWGIAVSATTASQTTYGALIAGLTPNDLPDASENNLMSSPTVFQYARAMNYKVHFFDGQMKSYWGKNQDDKNYIDSWLGIDELKQNDSIEDYAVDFEIARRVREIVSASTGNFIFIFKRGSHMPYQANYPKDAEVWKPAYNFSNVFEIPSSESYGEIVNSYDNSIKFNIDSFFQNLIEDYSEIPNNTVILYTGDHGQSFFTGGKSAHGGNTPGEANVPLFIIGRLENKVDTDYKASHQNLFSTMLDLMNFPPELRARKYPLSLLKAASSDSEKRYFNTLIGEKVCFD